MAKESGDDAPTAESSPGEPKGETPKPIMISIFKLTILGILWCQGDYIEKGQELYLTMVPGHHEEIAAETKLFKDNIDLLFYFSTEMPLEYEPKLMKTKRRRYLTEKQKKKQPELVEELSEFFHDEVFGYEGHIRKGTWIHNVSTNQGYIFDPELIRNKLGYPDK
jgi:hypothetical protein